MFLNDQRLHLGDLRCHRNGSLCSLTSAWDFIVIRTKNSHLQYQLPHLLLLIILLTVQGLCSSPAFETLNMLYLIAIYCLQAATLQLRKCMC